MQQKELRMARLKSAFLKLANNTLAQKPAKQAEEELAPRLPTNTPKKRRFEDKNESEGDNAEASEMPVSGTPPRSRSNTMHSTPYSTKRESSTPSSHRSRPVFATPGRQPLLDTTNRVNNRSVLSDQPVESPKKKPVEESLSDRLKQVEDSLQKLQVLGDLENVRAAAATLKSPQRARVYNSLRSNSAEGTAQNTRNNAAKETNATEQETQQHAPAAAPIPASTTNPPLASANEASSHTTHVPAPSHIPAPPTTVFGTGSNLLKPQLAEHLVLQATIQRATKASMKTLLKSRDTLPNASATRDQLAAYQQDTAKIATSLSPVNPNAAAEASIQVRSLETSIVHYHHVTSKLYPLSPLGDQSLRGNATAPVPLSELSMLKDKMTSWRSKYAPKPTVSTSV